jgi:hypothetical protein
MKSIIIRGAISHQNKPTNHLLNVVRTIRQWFNEELIICTWESELDKIPSSVQDFVNNIVYIKDPGPGPIQNIVRQLYSFQEGLKNSSGEDLLVTRSDVLFNRNIFLALDNQYKKHNSTLKFTDNKIIIGNIMSINPNSSEQPNTFRLSDWFHCGCRTDIEKLVSGFEFVLDADKNKLQQLFSQDKICTEKLWLLSILHAHFNCDLYDSTEIDNLCWDFIINNFVILNSITTLNTYNLNYPRQPQNMYCYITEEEYIRQYNLL